jgi:hypothetical protein
MNKTQEFYSIDFNSNNVELFVEVLGDYQDQELLTGTFNPTSLNVKKSQGRKAYDIVRLQDVFNFLISKNLREEFERNEVTGWKTYNVESTDFTESYYGFQCTGKCRKPIRPKESGFVVGYQFDYETWDGSDLFIPETTLGIICTQKVRDILADRKIKNIELVDLKTKKWYNS